MRSSRRALTLVEALVSLSITATLLAALVFAFHASANTIQANDANFRCTQTARLALNQITTEIRRADAVEVDQQGMSVQIILPANERTANEIYRRYSYDEPGKRITLQFFYANDVTSSQYELADNVAMTKFGPAETRTGADGVRVTVYVPISITCSTGGSNVTLAGSAGPRRAVAVAE
jgi:type II secretory pathway pseudopilin PulG